MSGGPSLRDQDDLAVLARLVERSERAVVFTGAGISTESGIPDFRSPAGIWTKMAPIDFESFLASESARCESWKRRFESDSVMREARPNRGHRAVAELVRRGKVATVITQNIDGLHQASGLADDQVIELHGNTTYAHCLDCAARYEIAALRVAFERDGKAPRCTRCDGFVKTATISFGQAMPEEPMRRARDAALSADLFMVVGSSLVVFPAAGFPEIAKRNGAALAIVNREPTHLDSVADSVTRRSIGEALGMVAGID
jgi:NAD-dependent deacetylase